MEALMKSGLGEKKNRFNFIFGPFKVAELNIYLRNENTDIRFRI